MIVNPKAIVKIGAVTGMLDPKIQVQQNGIDLTVEDVYEFDVHSKVSVLDFDNSSRAFPRIVNVPWKKDKEFFGVDEEVVYIGGGSYVIQYAETVDVPPTMAAHVFMRSSLMNMGARLFSALWDSGYKGKGRGLLVVSHPIVITKRARIGQIVFWDADSAGEYEGIHQGEGIVGEYKKPGLGPF
jgi:dUTP pyrophosphatase